jgi:hypothetical protein
MNFRLTSAWALLLALAASLSIPLIAQAGRISSEDRNRDGQADVWQYYDEDGHLVRVWRDRNFDGSVDAREVLNDHRIVSRSIDQNFDHRFDPSLTERIVDDPDVTFNEAPPPCLLPPTVFIGDRPLDRRACLTWNPAPERRFAANSSGRAPPVAL